METIVVVVRSAQRVAGDILRPRPVAEVQVARRPSRRGIRLLLRTRRPLREPSVGRDDEERHAVRHGLGQPGIECARGVGEPNHELPHLMPAREQVVLDHPRHIPPGRVHGEVQIARVARDAVGRVRIGVRLLQLQRGADGIESFVEYRV